MKNMITLSTKLYRRIKNEVPSVWLVKDFKILAVVGLQVCMSDWNDSFHDFSSFRACAYYHKTHAQTQAPSVLSLSVNTCASCGCSCERLCWLSDKKAAEVTFEVIHCAILLPCHVTGQLKRRSPRGRNQGSNSPLLRTCGILQRTSGIINVRCVIQEKFRQRNAISGINSPWKT